MRRFLLMLLVVLALPTFAQKDYQFRMSSFMDEQALVVHAYNYADPTGCDLRSIHKVDLVDPAFQYECIDSLFYDENGNITKLDTYQILEDGEYHEVCWVEYTYNEMGLRATRKNYNVFGDEASLGGIYYYYYNEEGQMTHHEMEFLGGLYERTDYTYENGLLVQEIWKNDFNFPPSGNYSNTSRVDYFYDDNDNMVEARRYEWSLEINDWELKSIDINEFDELGNCVVAMSTTPSGAPQVKYVYEYDDKVLAEDIYYYSNPEKDFPQLPKMNNMLLSYEFWALDQTTGGLVYVLDYILGYEVIGELGLSATAEANVEEICLGETIELNVEAFGGTGEYTYSWTPAEILNDAEIQNPTATPTEAGEVTFTVIVDDGIDTFETSVTVNVKDCTNIEEEVMNNINIYPNPAKDFIMIDAENIDYVEIVDIYGRVLTSKEINGETKIELGDFANGIYFVRLHSNGETAVQKVVKN